MDHASVDATDGVPVIQTGCAKVPDTGNNASENMTIILTNPFIQQSFYRRITTYPLIVLVFSGIRI